MSDLCVETADGKTRVLLRSGALAEVGDLLASAVGGRLALLVTDDNVGPLYAARVQRALESAGFVVAVHSIAPGDASKRLAVAEVLYGELAELGLSRDGVVVALGGGVVSDLAGFVAATWMRGVAFAICPTSLEAVVDACIGGKTAVNIAGGKNLVGVFHQPVLVVVDPDCLLTLGPRDVRAGLAESVKHTMIADEAFLAWHEEHVESILALEPDCLAELIERNLRIKADVVARDTHERAGIRINLNFGHTIGHAIEECLRYTLRHGECVALGMLAACRLSSVVTGLDESVTERLERLLARFALPTRLDDPIDAARILATISKDKKARSSQVQWVLLEAIGRPVVRSDVDDDSVRAAIESLR